jgi:homospermidine synthase
MVGCGSIGQAMLPLLRKHLVLPEDGLTVLEASEQGRALAAANHAKFVHCHLKPSTFQRELRADGTAAALLVCDGVAVPESAMLACAWRGRRGRALAGRVRQPDADDARAHELSHA